jgi:hypothetical protein
MKIAHRDLKVRIINNFRILFWRIY